MAEPKLLIPLKEQRTSVSSPGAQAVLNYRTTRSEINKGKTIQTPELDRAVGNEPEFTTAKTEDFVAPSQTKTNTEQALEIMGLLNPVDFSPEAVAEREWEKAGVKNAEEYRKVLPDIVQKDMNDLNYFLFGGGALLAAESGLENTVSSVAEAGRGAWDYLADSYKYGETKESKGRADVVSPLLLGFADEHAQASQDAMNIAKSNVNGTVGEVLLDATAAGTQMVGDIVVGAASGGSSMIPMAVRSFGAGVQEARNKGYSLEQQLALGLSNAAIEYVTEKFFGGNPFYDNAQAGLVNKFIGKMSQNKELLAFLSSAPVETLNEGLEEILAGVLNPLMEKVIAGQRDPIVLEELLKEGIVGVMLGGTGQVVNAITNGKKDTPATTEETSEPESPLIVQEQEQKPAQSTTEEIPDSPLIVQQEQPSVEPVSPLIVEGAPVVQAQATDGSFADMQEQAAQFHPINEQGAANAQANFGRDPVQVPVRNFEGHLTSKTASTMMNSGITPDAVVQSITDLLGRGEMSRVRFTDAEAVSNAQRTITNKGWSAALESFKADVAAGKRGKNLMALGIELFNNASTNGDVMTAADIAVNLVEAAREQAQAVQVLHLFNKATPEGRFYFAVKGIDNLLSRMEAKYGDRAAGIEVSQDLLNDHYEAVKSGDEQASKESWQAIQKDIAAQIPPNWKDRINAWRYLAMLGNPKTHIRNMAGNAMFMPVRMLKNTIGAGLEVATGTKQRTKAVLDRSSANDRALLQMSMQDYEAAMDGQMPSKYDESGNEIDRQRKILPGVLDKASKKNTEWLQKEDRWFSKPAYAQSMAGWLKANKITAQQFAAMLNDQTPGVRKAENLRPLNTGETVRATDRDNYGKVMKNNGDGTYQVHFVAENGSEATVTLDRTALIPTRGENGDTSFDISEATPAEILAEARAYAMQEAKKATYQDSNAFSDKIASFGKGDGIWSTAVSAVLPFKRTPANIIARGVEYSPAYLIKGIHEMRTGVKSGKVSAAEAIDHLASGMTGTAIMVLGAMLSHFDILRASGDDDEKQAAFDKLQGKQNYALSFGDKSFTIDWLAPEALPLFVGAELYNWWADKQEGETATAQDFVDSLASLTDPILETSMLSSINDLIDSVGYSDSGLWSIAKSVATNYLSSFVPTIGGQIERTFGETERQETYRYNDSDVLNASGQYDVGNILNKVPLPGADYGQIDYVDAWGRTQDQGNFLVRALNQFANPSYVSDDRTTEVDDELQRLYDAGQKAVLPQRRSQSDTIAVRDAEGNIVEERHLTAEEYERYNRTKGQTSLELVSQLMDSGLYASMNDDEKAKAIENIYSYATAVANLEAEPTTKVESWVKKAKESSDPGKYIQLYSAGQNLEPWDDNKTVSTWQKVELVAANANTEQADEFIPLYLEGNNPTKYEMARERGYSPARFVEAYTAMSTIESDRDANGESLGNVRKKVIAHLVSQGWPEANAAEMYKLFRADSGDLKNWKW